MKFSFLLFFFSFAFSAGAQYYYNDIIGSAELNVKMKALATNKIKAGTATGYDAQGSKSSDFNEWQSVDLMQNKLMITTRTGQSVTRQTSEFNNDFLVQSIVDSTTDFKSITTYQYQNGSIARIKIVTEDAVQGLSQSEEHVWFYNSTNKPVKMFRIMNGTDSSEYRFSTDESSNIIDEKRYLRNVPVDSVLYYYDDNNRLTDIVRYDKRAKKLLPDFMFEYDADNRVIQKISILSASNRNYLIWRYAYNDKGLKTKEALFNKDKELQGRIDYTYTE